MNEIGKIIQFLQNKNLLLTAAESCTAGLVASTLAEVSGCGSVFESSFVVYSPQAKQSCLNVSATTIDTFGLTSEEVAREMAIGALKASRAAIAIANTGKANSDDELDGIVCFAWALRREETFSVFSETVQFSGSRNQVRQAAARYGLMHLPDCYPKLLAPESFIVN